MQNQTKQFTPSQNSNNDLILVTGATGKTGRRVMDRLSALNVATRAAARSTPLPFDWHEPSTWEATLEGVTAIYLAYHPDLAIPGTSEIIRQFCSTARNTGVTKVVLLSGRGEVEAQTCEGLVKDSGLAWTIIRASWFSQNFSENFMREGVMNGVIALPAGSVTEPFVDADDIADVAVAALTEPGHDSELYEVTGPELLTFAEAARILSETTGRAIIYQPTSLPEFMQGLAQTGLPGELTQLLHYLFETVLDGRNSKLCDGIQRALGRQPRSLRDFAKSAAMAGAWQDETPTRMAV